MSWPWNPGQRSLKVIENNTIRSGTHNLLLTFHSNHWPVSHRFRDKRRFPPNISIFPPRILRRRWRGHPSNLVSAHGPDKTSMMGLSDGRKSFKIGLTVWTLNRRVTDGRTDKQTRCRSKDRAMICIVRVKKIKIKVTYIYSIKQRYYISAERVVIFTASV